jgi:hypothetical protein
MVYICFKSKVSQGAGNTNDTSGLYNSRRILFKLPFILCRSDSRMQAALYATCSQITIYHEVPLDDALLFPAYTQFF